MAGQRRGTQGAPSLSDVARLAGVSAQTVSRVAREEGTVRPETTRRVREAMRQLGFSSLATCGPGLRSL